MLLGSRSPQTSPKFGNDQDCIVLTEILEFALSLLPTAKGQEPFQGLPHLQAYRLLRAMSLMELGHVRLASRYVEVYFMFQSAEDVPGIVMPLQHP